MEISVWQSRIEAVQNNKAFETFVIVVIMIAAISVGAKTFDILPSAQNLIDYLNLLITWIFVFELTIRLIWINLSLVIVTFGIRLRSAH